jgi:hypothetical protein
MTVTELSASDEPYRCCGCGAVSLDNVKPCGCATGLGYRPSNLKDVIRFATKDENDNLKLAQLIETRLVGVHHEDQDLVLEDPDWRLIIAALRLEASR